MSSGRIDIASIRRAQIVDAATAIIAEQGLQNLSLSEIEEKAGMSRGQLIYYFRTKEQILLAVFDRVVQQMRERAMARVEAESQESPPGTMDCFGHILEMMLLRPPINPEFFVLQHTFLSQITHRPDFRQRLASLYEEWRTHMAEGLERDLAGRSLPASPRAVACVLQAVLHGMAVQMAADPEAMPREEVLTLCLDLVSGYLDLPPREETPKPTSRKKTTRKRKATARRES